MARRSLMPPLPAPWRTRAPKEHSVRCCWICGKIGGDGFTSALRWAGYPVRKGEMAYAHPICMGRLAREERERRLSSADGPGLN